MLYLKELKKICFSVVYVLFLGLLLYSWNDNFRGVTKKEIFASTGSASSDYTSVTGPSILKKPEKDGTGYGTKKKEVPEKIMCGGTDHLIIEYLAGK